MTWRVIARQDARETLDARAVRYLLGLFVLAVLVSAYVYPVFTEGTVATDRFSGFALDAITILLPLLGLLVGYNAIVGDRTSGALFLTLALPHSRRDVVLGALAGRAGVLAAAVVGALAVAGWLVVYPFGDLVAAPYLVFVALTVAFAILYTALGVALSMVVSTKQRATVAAFAVFFLFVVVWPDLQVAIEFGLSSLGYDAPSALEAVFALEPGSVYTRLVAAFVDPAESVGDAWYENEWLSLGLFAAWAVAPIGLAYRRFAGVDL